MSVRLESINGAIEEEVCNGTWSAIVRLARAYEGEKIPDWNGCHDGQQWNAEQLTLMADRLAQAAELIPILRELAKDGGVTIS